MDREQLHELVTRLANREAPRSEADVQSDVRALLLWGGLDLTAAGVIAVDLETPAGMRRRIDVEAGCAIVEVKKDLRVGSVAETAVDQLAGYVFQRIDETGLRFVGILTDGADWRLYHADPDGSLALADSFSARPGHTDVERLLVWLEAVLATRTVVPPTPHEIERRLGASSSAFALDRAELAGLYRSCRDHSEVALKRDLYAKLLTTAFGTQFANDDSLFVEHTLLVVMAKLIAHLVLGISVTATQRSPAQLLDGTAFRDADIGGVVEADFFDWVLDVEGGPSWTRSLARRLARFAWKEADHDVLKVLYESIISPEVRHRLGEYYTPDWLAERVTAEVLTAPLTMRAADVSCGSGTFLFHAVRRHLAAAQDAGMSNGDAITSVVSSIYGLDVHPVAVTLARVTYLLAIGTDRLSAPRGGFAIPVYLGDSIQWRHEHSLLSEGHVAVKTSDGSGLFAEELRFPESILSDADRFDRLVTELTGKATAPARRKGKVPDITAVLDRYAVEPGLDRSTVSATFSQLCRLEDEGRDQIWGYYVRNLVRPLWLAKDSHRVDALIGNPPWLSYRYMTPAMQREFRTLSSERNLWASSKVATHQDLSAFFVVRAVELYLKPEGRFGFVMPEAVLSRLAYAGFRTGTWSSPKTQTHVEFAQPWSFGLIRPPIFEVPSCVVAGTLRATPGSMPVHALAFTGQRPPAASSWAEALTTISSAAQDVGQVGGAPLSPYHGDFTQGATLVPRFLFTVQDSPNVGVLGTPSNRRRVTSRRDPTEKRPWRDQAGLVHAVERRFIRPLHLGRTLLPFGMLSPWLAIIPWDGAKLLSGDDPDLAKYPGLEAWWREAEALWNKLRSSDRLTLIDRADYQHTLRNQFPTPTIRVVYSASGQYLAAATVTDTEAIIDSKLYWGACSSEAEARYLVGIMNSELVTALLGPLQSRGEHNPRDFHKIVFQLPIPRFDGANPVHLQISALSQQAQDLVASLDLPTSRRFEALRRDCRDALRSAGILGGLNETVRELLQDKTPASGAI